jgi:hypothetical protein
MITLSVTVAVIPFGPLAPIAETDRSDPAGIAGRARPAAKPDVFDVFMEAVTRAVSRGWAGGYQPVACPSAHRESPSASLETGERGAVAESA